MYFFGDIVPANQTDINRASLCANGYESTAHDPGNRFCGAFGVNDTLPGILCRRNLAGTAVSYICPDGMFGNYFGGALESAKQADQTSQRIYLAPPCLDEDGQFKGFLPGLYVSSTTTDYNNTLWDAYDTNFLLFHCRTNITSATGYLRTDQDWRA
jgi:hypothetical protein